MCAAVRVSAAGLRLCVRSMPVRRGLPAQQCHDLLALAKLIDSAHQSSMIKYPPTESVSHRLKRISIVLSYMSPAAQATDALQWPLSVRQPVRALLSQCDHGQCMQRQCIITSHSTSTHAARLTILHAPRTENQSPSRLHREYKQKVHDCIRLMISWQSAHHTKHGQLQVGHPLAQSRKGVSEESFAPCNLRHPHPNPVHGTCSWRETR